MLLIKIPDPEKSFTAAYAYQSEKFLRNIRTFICTSN
jgi:hypothetical protein